MTVAEIDDECLYSSSRDVESKHGIQILGLLIMQQQLQKQSGRLFVIWKVLLIFG